MIAVPNVVVLDRMRRCGIRNVYWTFHQAHVARLGLPLACAMLMQESGGGRNEFGHDPTIFAGAGQVTKQSYLTYRALRDQTRRCQGVGPCQLTSAGLQDAADTLGGCWIPRWNMAVGFHYLAEQIRAHGLEAGVAAYNGSGPAAARYSRTVLERAAALKRYGCGTVIGVY
jgi:hypothetical protein